ncbi:MAG TPA: DUF805 domain-containing protein [Rhizomicrobium sp.]|nr:DUF805 domain-containing protein [Rhizomicrobium sp.]
MGFVEAVQSYLGGYVKFDGRSPRIMMWWILLFNLIVFIVAMILDRALGLNFVLPGPDGTPIPLPYGYIYCLAGLALFLPSLALGFRRLHDRNKSAWWIFIALIPIIGAIVLIVWMYFLRGTAGDNRFGPDPLGGKTA